MPGKESRFALCVGEGACYRIAALPPPDATAGAVAAQNLALGCRGGRAARSSRRRLLDGPPPFACSAHQADSVSGCSTKGLLPRRRRYSPVVRTVAGRRADRLYGQGRERLVPSLSARLLGTGVSSGCRRRGGILGRLDS